MDLRESDDNISVNRVFMTCGLCVVATSTTYSQRTPLVVGGFGTSVQSKNCTGVHSRPVTVLWARVRVSWLGFKLKCLAWKGYLLYPLLTRRACRVRSSNLWSTCAAYRFSRLLSEENEELRLRRFGR